MTVITPINPNNSADLFNKILQENKIVIALPEEQKEKKGATGKDDKIKK